MENYCHVINEKTERNRNVKNDADEYGGDINAKCVTEFKKLKRYKGMKNLCRYDRLS